MSQKKLIKGFNKKQGRNNQGKITVGHRGGGHKRNYRIIDFKFKFNKAIVNAFEYDPNRNNSIIKMHIPETNEYRYILAIENLKKNDIIYNNTIDVKIGNIVKLKNIPLGNIISNIELYPNNGSKISRSAGTYCQLIQKTDKYAIIKMSSGKLRKILLNCKAIIGKNSTTLKKKKRKAGFSRWLGKRPVVRGVAMNPIDHPHGGGEGKTSGGRPSVNKNGVYTKGIKTRNKKNKTNIYIL